MSSSEADSNDTAALIASIRDSVDSSKTVKTTLKTNERVIARVTDGIYRQPGSALRELISNAYDADATRVVINTDAPRFQRISVEDDGHGMSPEALAYLVQNIGGSAKRTPKGASLGMTSDEDQLLSPGGRRLIGKIGIGLFSVSQLTHSFQIVTKTKDDPFRTIATVVLRQFSDDDPAGSRLADGEYESGKVTIWRERASDVNVAGTTIVLTSIRRQAREVLRTQEIWSAIEEAEKSDETDGMEIAPPRFHIGRVDSSGNLFHPDSDGTNQSLPWLASDTPPEAFRKLVASVWEQIAEGVPNPRLEDIFDYYLRMVWQLSLSIPAPYVGGHLFDKPSATWTRTFLLSNDKGEAATEITQEGATVRERAKLADNDSDNFRVTIDGLELARPISFDFLPETSAALAMPLVFVGKCHEDFSRVQAELSGGPLSFEAYLFWSPKIAPVEHQGSLIRIHGSSGTLFDPTFMRYQIQEIRRLKQITCEIYVHQGLDGALNIDRESFNSAHPHAVFITKWLHGALRQLASAQKRLSSEVLDVTKAARTEAALSSIEKIAAKAWQTVNDDLSLPPKIQIVEAASDFRTDGSEAYMFSRTAVVPPMERSNTANARNQRTIAEQKVKAIAQVLAAYGLLDKLNQRSREQMLKTIFEILESAGA
ncbi:ATP-binding protein [Luteimonas sp. RIT-PG2_3]